MNANAAGDRRTETTSTTDSDALEGVDAAPDAAACTIMGCTRHEDLYLVDVPGKGDRVLCAYHAKHALGVSS